MVTRKVAGATILDGKNIVIWFLDSPLLVLAVELRVHLFTGAPFSLFGRHNVLLHTKSRIVRLHPAANSVD